jgi:hypothetical protein
MENLGTPERKPPQRLLGSKAADVTTGIIAGILWWVAGWGIASCCRHTDTGLVAVGVVVAFFVQVVVLNYLRPSAGVFVMSEILTVVLAPLLAVGLLFGACLLGGMKM